MTDHAIATPIWREEPTSTETTLLSITAHANSTVDLWFCAPESLDVSRYRRLHPEWKIRRFPDKVFASVRSYSLWLTQPNFYEAFSDFEFVTICQTDAVLINSVRNLPLTSVDYIGSEWDPPLTVLTWGRRIYVAHDFDPPEGLGIVRFLGNPLRVGNGGLSTRRVEAHIAATRWISHNIPEKYRASTLEDVLLCSFGARHGLRIADATTASKTYLESTARGLTTIPDVFGFHGLQRWNPLLLQLLVDQHGAPQ